MEAATGTNRILTEPLHSIGIIPPIYASEMNIMTPTLVNLVKVDCERYEKSRTLHITAKFQSNSWTSTVFKWIWGVIFMTQFYLLCKLVL